MNAKRMTRNCPYAARPAAPRSRRPHGAVARRLGRRSAARPARRSPPRSTQNAAAKDVNQAAAAAPAARPAGAAGCAAPDPGATHTQTFTLQGGWNAIYLEVEPLNTSPLTNIGTEERADHACTRSPPWRPCSRDLACKRHPGERVDLEYTDLSDRLYRRSVGRVVGCARLEALRARKEHRPGRELACLLDRPGEPARQHRVLGEAQAAAARGHTASDRHADRGGPSLDQRFVQPGRLPDRARHPAHGCRASLWARSSDH